MTRPRRGQMGARMAEPATTRATENTDKGARAAPSRSRTASAASGRNGRSAGARRQRNRAAAKFRGLSLQRVGERMRWRWRLEAQARRRRRGRAQGTGQHRRCNRSVLVAGHGNALHRAARADGLERLELQQRRSHCHTQGQRKASQHEAGPAAGLGDSHGLASDWLAARAQRGAAIFWSMAPKMLWPSRDFISMRMVSPNFMNPVEGLPSCTVSMARFSAMQL